MGLISGIVVYIIMWWVAFFSVLPLKVKRQEKPLKGTDPGAPENPHLLFKFLLASGIAATMWVIYFTLVQTGVLNHEIWI